MSDGSANEKKFQTKRNKKIFKNSDLEIIKKELLFKGSALSRHKDIGFRTVGKKDTNKPVEFELDPNQLFIRIERELKMLKTPIQSDIIPTPEMTLKKDMGSANNDKDEVKEDLPVANLSNANERITLILSDTKNYNNRNVILSQANQAISTNMNIQEPTEATNDTELTKQEGM